MTTRRLRIIALIVTALAGPPAFAQPGPPATPPEPPTTARPHRHPPRHDGWVSGFTPGARWSAWRPRDAAGYGTFSGPGGDIALCSWVSHGDSHARSHGRVYVSADFLRSSRPATCCRPRTPWIRCAARARAPT